MTDATRNLHLGWGWTPEGWRRDVRLSIADGRIQGVAIGVAAANGDAKSACGIPAVGNLHSHAFQRAMSGFAERRGQSDDSFWSWREAMYRFALQMSPEQAEAVAAQAYVEMLEAGYARVGEFHYLHHAPDGRPYANVAEMAERIAAAAAQVGIGLTLLPVFYAHSGFGGAAPNAGQRRFICDLETFARLVEGARRAAACLPGANVGLAPHSLRAVRLDELAAVTALGESGPMHIHVAEQIAEVEASLAWGGRRPVELLFDSVEIDARWCLIHATHMTEAETRRVALSGATVGLCPVTEANLGDGIFAGPEFLRHGGRFGIGTDSNVNIALAEELRLLEYGQRMQRLARNVLAEPAESTGSAIFSRALAGGAAALARGPAGFAPGADADIATFDEAAVDPRLGDMADFLDRWIFSGRIGVDRVYAQGRPVVEGGVHIARQAVEARFRKAMGQLLKN